MATPRKEHPKPRGGRREGSGRKRGQPSKATLAKAERAALSVERAIENHRELSVDVLRRYAGLFEGAASMFQPVTPQQLAAGRAPNPNEDWDKFGEWIDRAVDCHKAILPTETPRLSAMMVSAPPPQTATIMRVKLNIFEAPPLLLPAPDVEGEAIADEKAA